MLKGEEGLKRVGGAVLDFLVVNVPRGPGSLFQRRGSRRGGLGEGG